MVRRKVDMASDRLKIDRQQILTQAGIPEESRDPHTLHLAASMEQLCRELVRPRGGFLIVERSGLATGEQIRAGNQTFATGKVLARMLRNADSYAFFITTIGERPEQEARIRFAKGDYLEGMLLDLIASAMTDSAADLVQEDISAFADSRGHRITNRYSPGYCGWDVTEQQGLFRLFREDTFGVKLSGTSLMEPVKSVSGVIGIGPGVRFSPYTCEICDKREECKFRRTRPHGP